MDTTRILHVHLLGGLRLAWGGAPLAGLVQARLQFLLAYLLLHRSAAISRGQLAFTFWPDTGDEQAHTNLRTLLHRLRNALPESERFLVVTRHTILWHPDAPLLLDVDAFEAALARAHLAERTGDRVAERQALRAAIDAYTGDLLPPCYDEWIAPLRERLRQAVIQTTERLAFLLETEHDYHAAVEVMRRLLHYDPLHEATYRRLMQLQALTAIKSRSCAPSTPAGRSYIVSWM